MPERKVVVVLGMHRSGTSMIGGVLSRLGVDLGDDAIGRQVSNPLGHFEDRQFFELNKDILASAGGSWDDPPNPEQLLSQATIYSERISGLIAAYDRMQPERLWGWKDPRTSLTISLFSPYLDNLYLLWCQRDPEQIVKSLWQRNEMDRERSLALVSTYQQRIRDFIEENPSIPVLELPYQEIVQNPFYWTSKIVEFLELNPLESEIEEAVSIILPKDRIEKEKKKVQIMNFLRLPYRAMVKLLRILRGE